VIAGSRLTVAAPTPQAKSGVNYDFSSWSDGGDRVHQVTFTTPTTYTATFEPGN
jgi:hypothetical protein